MQQLLREKKPGSPCFRAITLTLNPAVTRPVRRGEQFQCCFCLRQLLQGTLNMRRSLPHSGLGPARGGPHSRRSRD